MAGLANLEVLPLETYSKLAQGKKGRRRRKKIEGVAMGRAQFASFFLEVAASSSHSPFSLEAAASSPQSPMSPFSAIAPSRFICVSRQQVQVTLDTIAEEDGGDHGETSSKHCSSFSATPFFHHKRAISSYN